MDGLLFGGKELGFFELAFGGDMSFGKDFLFGGNYVAVLVNDKYYGIVIVNRFFESMVLSYCFLGGAIFGFYDALKILARENKDVGVAISDATEQQSNNTSTKNSSEEKDESPKTPEYYDENVIAKNDDAEDKNDNGGFKQTIKDNLDSLGLKALWMMLIGSVSLSMIGVLMFVYSSTGSDKIGGALSGVFFGICGSVYAVALNGRYGQS